MKPRFVLLIFLGVAINLCAQIDSKFQKAMQNTFNNHHLNKWMLVNLGSESDSLEFTEGFCGDTVYYQYDGQSTIVSTRNNMILIDDFDRVIYNLPVPNKKYKPFKLKLSDSLYQKINVVQSDSFKFSVLNNAVFEINDNGNTYKIGIDTLNNTVIWMETIISLIKEDLKAITYQEFEENTVVRLSLINHKNNPIEINSIINPSNFLYSQNNQLITTNRFRNYELIDLTKQ